MLLWLLRDSWILQKPSVILLSLRKTELTVAQSHHHMFPYRFHRRIVHLRSLVYLRCEGSYLVTMKYKNNNYNFLTTIFSKFLLPSILKRCSLLTLKSYVSKDESDILEKVICEWLEWLTVSVLPKYGTPLSCYFANSAWSGFWNSMRAVSLCYCWFLVDGLNNILTLCTFP